MDEYMVSKVLMLNQISVKGLERLPREDYEIASEFTNPDAILLRSHKLKSEDIADSVLAIGRAGAGTNNIPIEACSTRGIPVFNSPGANANAVGAGGGRFTAGFKRYCRRYYLCEHPGRYE